MTNITQLKNLAMKPDPSEPQALANTPLPKNKPRGVPDDYIPAEVRTGKAYKQSKVQDFSTGNSPAAPAEKPGRSAPRIKNTPLQQEVAEEVKPKKPGIFKKLHDFDFKINKGNAPKFLPFILYISLWIILYIANHHYGEKTLLQINRVNREMKDLKADYYTSNAELSNKSIQSKVLEMVDTLGLKELRTPPKRLKLIQEDAH
jgi:hypothetical protein